ncbi:MAG TPA: YibE/F family protein [Lachnospiraceae bacterium]
MILLLSFILFVLLLLVGGEKGAISLLSLLANIFTLSVIVLLLSKGYSPLSTTALGSLIISGITLFYQNGRNEKTRAAFLTTILVMFFFSLFIFLIVYYSSSMGLNEIQVKKEEIQFYFNTNINISMLSVFISITLLSCLGAVLDTALSITSSLWEVKRHNPHLSPKEVMVSGYRIGRDIIGTTVNTLLFAYLGESFLLFAYISMEKFSFEMLLNSKLLFQNLSIMLLGSIFCLLSVPIASFFMAYEISDKINLFKRK